MANNRLKYRCVQIQNTETITFKNVVKNYSISVHFHPFLDTVIVILTHLIIKNDIFFSGERRQYLTGLI